VRTSNATNIKRIFITNIFVYWQGHPISDYARGPTGSVGITAGYDLEGSGSIPGTARFFSSP
jgi:hypothetical protein